MVAPISACKTHPHLDFALHKVVARLTYEDWLLLGECGSKIDHICGVPLDPAVAKELHLVSLVRGTQATTAIEGNTLSEEQVRNIHDGSLKLPPSQQYMQQEVENIIDAHNEILRGLGEPEQLTVEFIRHLNRQVLRGLEELLEDHVEPGEFSTKKHGVGNYRAPAPEYLPGFTDQFVATFSKRPDRTTDDRRQRMASNILRAVLAHLYFVWIHPFGDGNGRTARLIEHYILVHSGVPTPAAHLLVDHYNVTRARYARELARASDTGDAVGFIRYALEGFADGLRRHIDVIQDHQLDVAWRQYVYRTCPNKTETDKRRIRLMLNLPNQWVTRRQIPQLGVELAAAYGTSVPGKRSKALSRDLNRLRNVGLIEVRGRSEVRARREIVRAFVPAASTA